MVAERNGGKVPLYARLFAQWLHFAFPHECPFPHSSGSTNPLTPEDYSKATAEKSNMKSADIHAYIKDKTTGSEMSESATVQDDDDHLLKSWSDHEEMFFVPADVPRSFTATILKGVFVLAMGGCILFAAGDATKRFTGSDLGLGKAEKAHLV